MRFVSVPSKPRWLNSLAAAATSRASVGFPARAGGRPFGFDFALFAIFPDIAHAGPEAIALPSGASDQGDKSITNYCVFEIGAHRSWNARIPCTAPHDRRRSI